MKNENGLSVKSIVTLDNKERYVLLDKVDYKGYSYFICRKINSRNRPVSTHVTLMREEIHDEKVSLLSITDKVFLNEFERETGLLIQLYDGLEENTIITLDSEKKYLIKNQIYLNGIKYSMAIRIDNNRNIITTDVSVLEEYIGNGSLYVKCAANPDILAEAAKSMVPNLDFY